MRCFLALVPDPDSRERLLAVAAGLPAALRRVPAANLHLTLAFLGERTPAEVERWCAGLAGVAFAGVEGRG